MTKQEAFLEFWHYLTEEAVPGVEVPENVQEFVDAVTLIREIEKKEFTTNGELILRHMQKNVQNCTAKTLAQELNLSSRGVSGAMRKLVTDGYVEKIGQNPIIYSITNKGKNVIFEEHEEINE